MSGPFVPQEEERRLTFSRVSCSALTVSPQLIKAEQITSCSTMPEMADSTTATHSKPCFDNEEENRRIHRARTLEQLTPDSSTSRNDVNERDEARRLRRSIAGRCGGEFKVVEDHGQQKYRYVWPDSQSVLIDRLIAWAHPVPEKSSDSHEQSDGTQSPTINKPVNGHNSEGKIKMDASNKEWMLT